MRIINGFVVTNSAIEKIIASSIESKDIKIKDSVGSDCLKRSE